MTIDWTYVARDGAILAAGACGLIALMLRRNPRLFLRHFPAALRDRLPAKSPAERRESLAGGLALIGWILGVLLVSTAAAETRLEAGMAGLVLHAFLVGMAFNLADWLILDELWLGIGRPGWLLPAEVDAAAIRFDHGKHFRDFLKGSAGMAVLAVLTGLAVRLT